VFEVAVSVDQAGILEYWTGPSGQYKFPRCVLFNSKLDTDLFEFAKNKTFPTGLSFSPDGEIFATLSGDRKVVHSLKFIINKRLGACLQQNSAHSVH
jgi:peptidylprolyl isomerase domain and WD repeat-containing protein 1